MAGLATVPCTKCGEVKPVGEFAVSYIVKRPDRRESWCKLCKAASVRKRRARRSESLRELKKGPCVDCGLALKDQPGAKRLEPLGDRISEARLKEISDEQFAAYCRGAVVVCLLCLERRLNPPPGLIRTPLVVLME